MRQPIVHDWYWTIAGDATRAWSSAARAFVLIADVPEDVTPTQVASFAELVAVFERAGFPDLAPRNANHVRRECDRRMIALLGARDARDRDVKISNATREATRLLRKGEANWMPVEVARAAWLEAVDAAIEQLRACSNAMEADPPADYADDARWQ